MDSLKKHILIADSDEETLINLERLLQDEGFETTTAWSTSDTVNHLRRERFDLILVADHPPELNCEYVLRIKRQAGREVPVVVLATRPRHPFSEPYLLTLGANTFVQKWHAGDVRSVVHGMLGTGRAA